MEKARNGTLDYSTVYPPLGKFLQPGAMLDPNTIPIEFSVEELQQDWNYLENKILAELANKVWGKEYFFKQLLVQDNQAQDALKHFNDARKLFSN